jgi:L-ascorbate metabolism protein UlaG (beta-lactamase superfamily)
MFRYLVALTVGLAVALTAASQEGGKGDPKGDPKGGLKIVAKPPVPGKPTISWVGQSFFVIWSSKGTALAIDPHNIDAFGIISDRRLAADAVIFSHLHNDHTQKEVLVNGKDIKVIPGMQGKGLRADWTRIDEKIKNDIHVRNVGTYHDDMEGMMYGKNSVFIIDVDGFKIAHLGDLGHELTDAQLKKIGPVDVVLIPVGGVYTLNGAQARKVVEQLRPKEYVIPMHYGNARYSDLLTIDEFLDDNPAPALALSKDDALVISKDRKEWGRLANRESIKADNTLILDRDPNRPRPLLTVLNWMPQLKKGKQDKDKKEGK